MRAPSVVVLDYGSGNVRSAVRALERAGADVELTADLRRAQEADGLLVPGVGAFAAVAAGLRAVGGDRVIGRRLAGSRPVLGICVGLQVLFERSTEPSQTLGSVPGLGEWPGVVERLDADVVPHSGWSEVQVPPKSQLFDGIADQRFYFVHSYAVRHWELQPRHGQVAHFPEPLVTWAEHGSRFVAAVENGPLSATQFHPEKSGAAGAQLLRNWVQALR